MPKVSVIMPVYNGERFLAEAIESVLRQTFEDFELICVNDGSTDRSQDIIDGFSDPRLKSIVQRNAGLPNARNTGIRASKGQYIAFLDCDDLYFPFSLEKRVDYLSSSEGRFLVHSDFIVIDETGVETPLLANSRKNVVTPSGKCFKRLFLEGTVINTCSVMIKRDVLKTIGYFDESFFHAEDYDMWLRISYRYPISFISEATVKYRMHTENMSHNTINAEIYSAKALLKAAENVPDIEKIIGKSAMRKRLHQVCFDVAYQALTAGDLDTGRYWLKKAWQWGRRPKSLFLLVAGTCFGPLVRKHYSGKKAQSIS